MTLRGTRVTKVAVVGATLALAAAACGGNNNKTSPGGGGGGTKPAEGKKGGTLYIINTADFEHIDPQRTYVGNALNVTERFLTRTLTTYKSVPGPDGSKLEPDMATDLGTPTDGNKTWSFTLKDGLKYQDGTEVTCEDIKYGISRSFSSDITDGPAYAQTLLDLKLDKDGVPLYKGPYLSGPNGGFDQAVTCEGKKISFHLKDAVGDFNYTVTLPQFAAVPKAKDTKAQYDNNVFSNGPYKIASYVRGKSLTLVRNDKWNASTDPVRKAYPNKVVVSFGADPAVIDQQFLGDIGNAKTGVMNDTNVQAQDLARVLNTPNLKQRSVSGFDGFALYVTVNTSKVTNKLVRQAIGTATNVQTMRGAYGGALAGDYSRGMITPALKSHKDFDVYGVQQNPTGDPAKAKQLLQQAGVKTPYPLTVDVRNKASYPRQAAALKEALERNGNFAVTLNPIDPKEFYSTVGKKKTEHDLAVGTGWGPDWPNGSSVIPPLFDGALAHIDGSPNYSQLDDPEINAGIKAANQETDLDKQAPLWGDLDQKVVEYGAIIPTIWSKTNQMFGSGVKGAFLHAFYGEIDVNPLSVA